MLILNTYVLFILTLTNIIQKHHMLILNTDVIIEMLEDEVFKNILCQRQTKKAVR